MKRHNKILMQAAEDFNIKQGDTESEESYEARIIYSLICRLAYASLWDNLPESTISIQHFKNKIEQLLKIYLEIYPEVKISENLSAEIYDLYLKTGNFYHKAHQISASIFSATEEGNILFLRGVTPSQKTFISGAGFYLSVKDKNFFAESKLKNFVEMFGLQDKTLLDFWQEIIYSADWKEAKVFDDAEFLKMSPPFNKGYWQKNPAKDGKISLARIGQFEPKNYYLYKFEGEKFFCSHLSDWLAYNEFFAKTVEYDNFRGGTYRQISCACLTAYESLPPIKFKLDESIVQVKIEYLPPPAELYLLILYSWAENLQHLPNNFNRIFDTEVFFALKAVFEKIGYTFIEE